jgi:hypothetical protein
MVWSDDLPTIGNPNSSREKRNKKGKIIQRRFYDGDGKAIIDIDYEHDHTGAGNPHAHDWNWTKDPPVRLPPRPLRASDEKRK